MKKVLFVIFVLFSSSISFAAINPIYRCDERGYERTDEYCIFPDGNKCPIEDFAYGKCGTEYTQECVQEGENVWGDLDDKCCSGLVSFLREGMVGQTTCELAAATVVFNPIIWALIIVVILIVFVVYKFLKKPSIRKSRRKRRKA